MKLKTVLIVIISLCFGLITSAQTLNEDVLFTVDGDPVMANEFIRVYSKNIDLVKDENQKDIDQYLKLFINYKLKIKEAKALEYDKKPSYVREFTNYKKQLSKNYLTDHEVTESLVEEAYNRISYDVKVSHILMMLPEHEKDTTQVFNQMLQFKDRLENEDFETLKPQIHDGSNVIVEDLGYFSGFKMVYPFETVAFNTEIGQVSKPFRTRFGYHVLKVYEKRQSRGEVTVGHIMVKHNQTDSIEKASQRIQEIYKLIKKESDFESLAKQFSEDQSSASKGGKLPTFKSGQLSSVVFEDVAFSLNEIGEISEPFESQYGWHIAKLYEKKPLATFEQMKSELEQRVKRDARSKVITESFVGKLKKKYKVPTSVDLSYFESILTDEFFARAWSIPEDLPKEKPLLKIGDQQLTYSQFGNYLQLAQKKVREKIDFNSLVRIQFDEFLNEKVLAYHESNLENENEEYANVLAEYRDGLLLFDLMENKVWNAVKEDTLALEDYYNRNKNKYKWPERIDVVIVSGADAKHISQAKEELENNIQIDSLKAQINTEGNQNIIITSGLLAKNHQAFPNEFTAQLGVSKIYNHNSSYHVIKVNEILPESFKTFEESRGNVISDYQIEFEESWLNTLKAKYKIDLNTAVLDKIKIQINN